MAKRMTKVQQLLHKFEAAESLTDIQTRSEVWTTKHHRNSFQLLRFNFVGNFATSVESQVEAVHFLLHQWFGAVPHEDVRNVLSRGRFGLHQAVAYLDCHITQI